MKKFIYITILSATVFSLVNISACKKLNEAKPEDAFTEEEAIKSPQDVQMLLNSAYDALANQLNGRVQYFNDLLSDDLRKPLKDDAGFSNEIYNRSTNIFNSDVGTLYRNLYLIPFRVNTMANYYDKVNVSTAERTRMDAEGKFLRALCHFEVLKLWAQPNGFEAGNTQPGIVLRKEVSQLPGVRSTVAESFDFIVSDLQTAIANLPENNGNYADKKAAKALLAKVYYMMNKPNEALVLLDDLLAGNPALDTSLNRFQNQGMSNTGESLFTIISTSASTDNRSGQFTEKYRSDNQTPSFTIAKELYQILKADTMDKRGKQNVLIYNEGKDNEYYAVTKFNKDYFNVPYLTLTDMYLTRAELLAETGTNLPRAIDDVNMIIARAYNDSASRFVSPAASQSVVLAAVRLQRRLEFFAEGDRVQTLKRRGGKGEPITIRNAPWGCPGMILQFPSTENGQGFVFNGTGGCN
jgi:hypothetical protein